MSVAWTTFLVIALLLPGVFFLIGFAARERYSREIVRSSAVGEVGLAILFATFLHLLAWWVLSALGFDLSFYLRPLADYQNTPNWLVLDHAISRLWAALWYMVITAAFAWLVGRGLAAAIVSGWFRFLATHKWVYEVIKSSSKKNRVVTAFVMTKTVENNRALMYKGRLEEFYLNPDGKFAYIVMKNCTKFYLQFDDDMPTTGKQLSLFGPDEAQRPRLWNYLMIDGENIANILFEPSPEIEPTTEGTAALDRAIKEFTEETEKLRKLAQAASERMGSTRNEIPVGQP